MLAYYNSKWQTKILVDGSPIGVAAILTQQQGHKTYIVAYASRALTPVEQRYSQLEREALAILFGCECFRLYLLGSQFTVVTDHKPLVPIFRNPHVTPSARVEGWLLRLQSYNFTVEYSPGKTNPSDFMSRNPVSTPQHNTQAEAYINFVISSRTPMALSQQELEKESRNDPIITKVISMIQTGRWPERDPQLAPFINACAELSTDGTVLLRGQRIVIAQNLQSKAILLAHEGHQGLVKMKSLMRTKVWFPGMDQMIEQKVAGCVACHQSRCRNYQTALGR